MVGAAGPVEAAAPALLFLKIQKMVIAVVKAQRTTLRRSDVLRLRGDGVGTHIIEFKAVFPATLPAPGLEPR